MPKERRPFIPPWMKRHRRKIYGALVTFVLWIALFAWIGSNSDWSKGLLDGLFFGFAWFPIPLVVGAIVGSFFEKPL